MYRAKYARLHYHLFGRFIDDLTVPEQKSKRI